MSFASLVADPRSRNVQVEPAQTGMNIGSHLKSTIGGESFYLSIANCYRNDKYREAMERRIEVTSVEVEVNAGFGGIGEATKSIQYPTMGAASIDRQIRRSQR